MDCYELKELLAESVRNLARTMDQVRLRELENCAGKDEPMQDHLSICVETAVRLLKSVANICLNSIMV